MINTEEKVSYNSWQEQFWNPCLIYFWFFSQRVHNQLLTLFASGIQEAEPAHVSCGCLWRHKALRPLTAINKKQSQDQQTLGHYRLIIITSGTYCIRYWNQYQGTNSSETNSSRTNSTLVGWLPWWVEQATSTPCHCLIKSVFLFFYDTL